MAVLTVRGLSDQTLDLLRRDADHHGRSLSRHVALVLDERAELLRRRDQLRRLGRRLEAVRARLTPADGREARPSADSAALLWAERGGR